MRLKNPNRTPQGGFVFYYVLPDQSEGRIPVTGSANGIKALAVLARAILPPQGITVPQNIEEIIEHQICLRQPNPTSACWKSGIGDSLHHSIFKPLSEKLASAISSFAPKAAARVRSIGGCSSCSGTKTYDQRRNNLGRAGTLNKLHGNSK